MTARPAILGGEPAFDPPIAFARPTIEETGPIIESITAALHSGQITDGPLTRELEARIADRFGVENCVAVSSATVGLMLVIQALGSSGPVLLPSFTFAATAHAVAWNGLPMLFADCSSETWCLQPEHIYGDPDVVLAVHVSGNPCDVDALERACADIGATLIFDAAHGAGSLADVEGGPRPLGGFGRAEVFSLTPTKVLSGAEGGLITTNNTALAEQLRLARNYGNPGNYDTQFAGLNARLSEPHAALALQSLDHLEERVHHRNETAARYRTALSELPGVTFQNVPTGARSSYKDFSVLIDPDQFGCSRGVLASALAAEGVDTRTYYSPPVHRHTAYRDVQAPNLPATDQLASRVLTLPMWSHIDLDVVDRIGAAISRIQRDADQVAALAGSRS